MARPRKPEVPYVEPTNEERSRGETGECVGCEREWPLRLFVPSAKRCVNCARQLYRTRSDDRALLLSLQVAAPGAAERRAELLRAQNNRCLICTEPFASSRVTHADHDHKTNVFRGFLCGRCNTGLGQFRDDPALLDAAAAYLRAHVAIRGKEREEPLSPSELIAGESEVTRILLSLKPRVVQHEVGVELQYDVDAIRAVLRAERSGLSTKARATADRIISANSKEWSKKVQADLATHLAAARGPLPSLSRNRLYGSANDPCVAAYVVARDLRVSLPTVAAWIKNGTLPTVELNGVHRVRVFVLHHIKKELGDQPATADSVVAALSSLRML